MACLTLVELLLCFEVPVVAVLWSTHHAGGLANTAFCQLLMRVPARAEQLPLTQLTQNRHTEQCQRAPFRMVMYSGERAKHSAQQFAMTEWRLAA